MRRTIYNVILIWTFTRIKAKDPELPLCPTNMQYFPQNLPMHCRMPVGSPPRISRSPSDKPPQPIQFPMNGYPGSIPGGIPGGGYPGAVPGSMPVQMQGGFPGISRGMPGPPPGAMPMPMPMPMLPPPSPAQKLPVIVMPFYSQDTSAKTPQAHKRVMGHKKHKKSHMKKRSKHHYSDEDSIDTDSSDDDSSANVGWWKNSRQSRRSNHHKSKKHKHRQQELLRPVLQYVTKDGYVIYEKQISKGEAKSWLGSKNTDGNEDGQTHTHQQELESHEPKDEVETGFLVKEDDRSETTTEDKVQMMYRKKNLKRKVSKKHV